MNAGDSGLLAKLASKPCSKFCTANCARSCDRREQPRSTKSRVTISFRISPDEAQFTGPKGAGRAGAKTRENRRSHSRRRKPAENESLRRGGSPPSEHGAPE